MSNKVFIFGATGNIGLAVALGFAARDEFIVSAALRPESRENSPEKVDTLENAGITLVDIEDFTNVENVTVALSGFDTVVSILGGQAASVQVSLIEAAQAAGVKLFVPSEFGVDFEGYDIPLAFLGGKDVVREALRGSTLNYFFFLTGVFLEYALNPFFGFNFEANTVEVPDGGEFNFTSTSIAQVAQLLPLAVLKPESSDSNKIVRTSSFAPISFNQFIDLVDSVRDQPLERIPVPLQEYRATVNDDSLDPSARFPSLIRIPTNSVDEAYNSVEYLDLKAAISSIINQ